MASLYLGQVVADEVAHSFPCDVVSLSLVPGATLAGYAFGVSVIAFGPASRVSLPISLHMGLLTVSLCAAGLARDVTTLATASLAVGAGASVAQRLLAAAGRLGGPNHGATFIGQTIGAALIAVLAVRLLGGPLTQVVGWRILYLILAAVAALFGLLNSLLPIQSSSGPTLLPATPGVSNLVGTLWRRSAMLRWATFQHCSLFAAYNLAWMTILVEVPAQERAAVVIGGGGAGVVAALLAGYCVDRFTGRDLARYGAAAVAISTASFLPLAYQAAPGFGRALLLLPGMALLDGGLQIALVANQARVQALLPDARPRVAALLTVCGSLAGAIGAGIGYWSWQHFGWRVTIGAAGIMGLLGLGCAVFAGSRRLSGAAQTARQHHFTNNAAATRPAVLRGVRRLASQMPVRRATGPA